MVRYRRPLLLALAIAAVVSGTAVVASASRTSATAGKARAASSKTVTISVYDTLYFPNKPGYGPLMKKWDAQFMRLNPNIKIKHYGFPFSAYVSKVQAAWAAKSGPDVIQDPGVFVGNERRNLWPLLWAYNHLMPAKERANLGLVTATRRAYFPSLEFMPWTGFGYFWQYNKSLFSKAGLSGPPQTWSQLLGACDKLNAIGVTPLAVNFNNSGGQSESTAYYQWIDLQSRLMSPADFKRWQQFKVNFDHKSLQEPYTYLKQLQQHKCYAPNAESMLLTDAQALFYGGKAGMHFYWNFPTKDQLASIGKDNIDFFLTPRIPDQVYKGPVMDAGANSGWGIPRYSKSCVEAFKYIRYIVSAGPQNDLAKSGLNITNNNAVKFKPQIPAEAKVFKWMQLPDNHFNIGAGPEVSQILYREWLDVMAGRKSVEDATKELNQAWEKDKQQYKPYADNQMLPCVDK
jgi:ABC-type glycerol-3-phosphate transport system substrate-binding protein